MAIENDEVEILGSESRQESGISFWKAWLLPGVIPLSLSYTGLKLANYSIMLWLPTFATQELNLINSDKAVITILYDVGTLGGSLILGLMTDLLYGKRSPVCVSALAVAFIC